MQQLGVLIIHGSIIFSHMDGLQRSAASQWSRPCPSVQPFKWQFRRCGIRGAAVLVMMSFRLYQNVTAVTQKQDRW